jgi:hypothetical protein
VTGNLVLDLLISAGGVALLVAISAILGGWRSATLTETAVRERLAFDEPDFSPAALMLGVDGRTAAAQSETGEVALVFRVGDGLATRRFRPGAFPVAIEGGRIIVALKDPSIWRLALAAPDAQSAQAWAGRLTGQAVASTNAVS